MQKFKRGVVDSENTNRMTDEEDKKETHWSRRETKSDVREISTETPKKDCLSP